MNRIYHTYDKWECYPCGFFEESHSKFKSKEEGEVYFSNFFRDLGRFEKGLVKVTEEWKFSCQHNLTNENLNRIAWLGQAAICALEGIPSCYRSGYSLLSKEEQQKADELALLYLNKWLQCNNYPETDGVRKHKSADIY